MYIMATGSILLSEDNARFLRCTWLLKKVGRLVLLEQFSSSDLQNNLKIPKIRSKIQKRVNRDQFEKLYPSTGQPPDPSTFDITLLALVLKVVFNWADPQPPLASNDISKQADVSRLREFRNENAHSSHMAIPESVFEIKWEEHKQVLLRLGRPTIPDLEGQIDELKEAPIDPEREKELKDIIEYWKELAQLPRLPQGVKSLMTNSKDFLEDCVPDEYYVKTNAYLKAKEILSNGDRLVISGLPGEGKTTMAKKLAMELSVPEKCMVLENFTDWDNVDTEKVPIEYLIIEDIFGERAFNERYANIWESLLKKIKRRMKQANFKVIITTRHYILKEAKLVARYESFFKKEHVVLLSSKDLTVQEQTRMLTGHILSSNRPVRERLIEECIGISTNYFGNMYLLQARDITFGFPQCVHMFVNTQELYKEGPDFFANPKKFFMQVLKDLKRDRDRDKFLALILVWARGGKLRLSDFSSPTVLPILKSIARSFDFFLETGETLSKVKYFLTHHDDLFDYQQTEESYTFSHNVIGDMVGLVLSEEYQQQTLEYSSRDFILEYVTIDKDNKDKYHFYVKKHKYSTLSKRIANLMLQDEPHFRRSSVHHLKRGGRCPNKLVPTYRIDTAFMNKDFFQNEHFVKCFVASVIEEGSQELFKTPVMTMSGHFLGTGITNEAIDIYLPDYFLLNENPLVLSELIKQNISSRTCFDAENLELSLTIAVYKKQKEMAEILLRIGADATQETVYIAAVHENIDLIKMLLQSNNSIKTSTKFKIVKGNSPLIISAKKGLFNSVLCLIENGADIKYRNNGGHCALDKAVLFKHADVCRLLLNAGSPVNERQGKFNRTPLHVASDIGSVEIVRLLLNNGASDSLQVKDHRGHCPIHCAAFRGHIGVVEALLQHDASLATQRAISYGQKSVIRGMTVYHIAVWKKNLGLIQMLVGGGVNPDTKDFFGRTPLYCAVFDDKEEIVKLLLSLSDPNAADKKGRTPLYCAALNGKKHLVELLLPHADPNVTDKQGRTPLCAAMINKNMAVANLLCNHADVNKTDKEGATVLHEACKRGNVSFVLALIGSHRADYLCRDKKGRTAYDVATPEVKRAMEDANIEVSYPRDFS